jgi:hypothetical protein
MKTFKTLALVLLGVGLAATLTTVAKADLVEEFYWVQGAGPRPTSLIGEWLNPGITSVGNLTYDVTTATISGYSFVVTGAVNLADNQVVPPAPDSIVLGDGNLHLSPTFPSGDNVLSISGITGLPDGAWVDDVLFDAADENYFQVAAAGAITGDWVPVPEASTIIAGLLILLPFGVSAARILRNKRSLTA